MKDLADTTEAVLEALKQFIIVGILVCLFAYPAAIGTALSRIGITEGDLWGLKWKNGFVATDAALVAANATIEELKRQLQAVNSVIKDQQILIGANVPPTAGSVEAQDRVAIAGRVSAALAQNADALKYAERTIEASQQVAAQNAPLIDRAQEAVGSAPQWAVVAGGDSTENSARDELNRARSAGFPSAALYQRQGSFRTLIEFPDRTAATAALPSIQSKMRRQDAYIVNLDRWCPGRSQFKPDLYRCQGDQL